MVHTPPSNRPERTDSAQHDAATTRRETHGDSETHGDAVHLDWVRRGERALLQLQRQAELAKVEIEKAELEALITKAQNGDAAELQSWLEQHGTAGLTGPHISRSDPFASDPVASSPVKNSLAEVPMDGISDEPQASGAISWSKFVPAARERLQRRAAELRILGSESSTGEPKNRESLNIDVARQPATRSPALSSSEAKPKAGRPRAELRRLASQFGSESHTEKKQQQRRLFVFSGLRGAIASAMAHILLIGVLALITLRLPGPPAGMSLNSVSATAAEDAFELTQPMEASAPEQTESEMAPSESVDLASELAEVSASVSNAFGDMAPAPTSPSTAASLASVASASSAAAMSTNASFFGAAANGNCFCYVIDASGSMRGGPWEAARIELLKSLASLKPKQRFYILLYTRDLIPMPEPGEREPAARPLYATRENLEHARRWVTGLNVGGTGAAPKNALKFAIDKEPDAIYLLTDGVTRVKDVAEFVRTENRIMDIINGEQVKVPIHTIAFYSLKGQQLLKQLASENRGQFIYVPDPTK